MARSAGAAKHVSSQRRGEANKISPPYSPMGGLSGKGLGAGCDMQSVVFQRQMGRLDVIAPKPLPAGDSEMKKNAPADGSPVPRLVGGWS